MELNQWSDGENKKFVFDNNEYSVSYRNDIENTIDIQCGNASYILGYSDSDIISAMNKNSVKFLRGNSGETSEANEELINLICSKGNWDSLAWAVSGSDAVESAINMNDKYWEYQGLNKPKILAFNGSYHGCTMLCKHLRGEYSYLNRAIMIEPPTYESIKHRHLLERLVLSKIKLEMESRDDIGCIIMETVPWSTGPYSKEWWESIRKLCDDNNVLMIVDDVALCWGKLGTLFGYQFYGVQPDISTLAKSLTAGYAPLSASVCNKKVGEVLKSRSWEHTQTYLPNMIGVYASLEATKKIETLLPRVEDIHNRLKDIARKLNFSFVGEGLFVEFRTNKHISLANLYNAGLSASIVGNNSIKIIAPLIADEHYFGELFNRLNKL